jgi:hypothetical protein
MGTIYWLWPSAQGVISSAGTKDSLLTVSAQKTAKNSHNNEDPLGWLPRRPVLDPETRIWGRATSDIEALQVKKQQIEEQQIEEQQIEEQQIVEQPVKTRKFADELRDTNALDRQESTHPSPFSVALNDTGDQTSGLASVSFTFTPLPDTQFVSNPTAISARMYVYAHVQTTENCPSCVLMWEYQDSRQIELLHSQRLLANQVETVFLTPENGWQVGSYSFSIHDRDNDGEVIGRDTLTIHAISDELPAVVPPVDYIQSLLDSGLAVPKQF